MAIVGYNGAGKTTLIKLLMRLYDPSAGTVSYHGKDIKEYVYGSPYKTAFEASVDVIESSYKDISTFIKKTFPELNETEYKVCLLSVVPISVEILPI